MGSKQITMDTMGADLPKANQQEFSLADSPPVVLKGSVFTLSVLKLNSCDIVAIEQELTQRLASALDFFKNAPVVLDLENIQSLPGDLDLVKLTHIVRQCKLIPVGICNGSKEQTKAAIAAELAILTSQSFDKIIKENTTKDNTKKQHIKTENNAHSDATKQNSTVFIADTTKIIHHPIRSGQRVYAKGCDLILLAAVNAGAEVMADGNIHIYGPLRGRALAGLDGNENSRIFCQSFEAELAAIAGNYRVFEDNVPEDLFKKTVQIYLSGEQLNIETIGS